MSMIMRLERYCGLIINPNITQQGYRKQFE